MFHVDLPVAAFSVSDDYILLIICVALFPICRHISLFGLEINFQVRQAGSARKSVPPMG